MRVFVTGATGLVGAHSAMALMDAGHELRLLVRNSVLARAYFRARGYSSFELVVADMLDTDAVARAIGSCEAVLHAAALVSLDPRLAREVYQTNLAGVDSVIVTACELGIANIVHVSSLGALFRPGATGIDEYSPLGDPRDPYSRSKRDGDARVRALQQRGYPVQISYPGGVFGPQDPKLSEGNGALASLLSSIVPNTSTGIQCVDARDLALAHRYLVETPYPGESVEARFILAGHYFPWSQFHGLLQGLTRRNIPHPPIPPALFRLIGRLADLIKRVYPFSYPIGAEAMSIVTQWTPADSSKITREAGLSFRPPEHTFTETVRWLVEAGHLKPKFAGQLLNPGPGEG